MVTRVKYIFIPFCFVGEREVKKTLALVLTLFVIMPMLFATAARAQSSGFTTVLDVYTNQVSFVPGEAVVVSASVKSGDITTGFAPDANQYVTFTVTSPLRDPIFYIENVATNSAGVATTNFTMPSNTPNLPPYGFGSYTVEASVSVAEVPFSDSCTFSFNAPALSVTSAHASPSPIESGSLVTCTATVSGANPTGTITWTTSSSTGTFSSTITSITSGVSTTSYSDTSLGSVTITATYSGDSYNVGSVGTTTLTILNPQVTITTNYGNAGTVNLPTGNYGQTPTRITATANAGFVFCYWLTSGGAVLASNSSSTTLTASATGTVEAIFASLTPIPLQITNVQMPPAAIQTGFTIPINVVVTNLDKVSETARIQVWANSTLVFSTTNFTLGALQTEVVACNINSFVLAPVGNYASTVILTTNTLSAPNTETSTGQFGVTYLGDVNGDSQVNFNDIVTFVADYISYNTNGIYYPAIDYEHIGTINFNDIVLFVAYRQAYYSSNT